MVYLIQMAAERFTFAPDIDPAYVAAFRRARSRGVEALAYVCDVTTSAIRLSHAVPIDA